MTDTAKIEALLDWLDERALSSSETAQRMMEAKSLRQAGNTEGRKDLYLWPWPEQTLEGQAASTIRALSAENEQARRQAYEECEAIAATYREEAGGSERYNRACRHIQEGTYIPT